MRIELEKRAFLTNHANIRVIINYLKFHNLEGTKLFTSHDLTIPELEKWKMLSENLKNEQE